MDYTSHEHQGSEARHGASLDVPGLPIEAIAVDGPSNALGPTADGEYWSSQAPWILGGLVALGAPDEVTVGIPRGGPPDRTALERIRRFLHNFWEDSQGAEVVDSRIVWVPVDVLMAASTAGVTIVASLSCADTRKAGWKLSLGGLSLSGERTYELSTSLSVTIDRPGGQVLEVLVPLFETIRRVVPNGGREAFNMSFYEHCGPAGPTRLGSRARNLDIPTLMRRSVTTGPPTPIGGTSSYEDRRSYTTKSSSNFAIDSSTMSLSSTLSATIESQMKIDVAMTIAPGEFYLEWLEYPLGARVRDRAGTSTKF